MGKRNISAGFYITIIFHLLVLIVLLSSKINYFLQEDNAFIIDFSREEEIAKLKRQERLKEEVSKEIDQLLSGRTATRNVAVDRSSKRRGEQLRDDRYSDPSQIYKEAENLQKNLERGKREADNLERGDIDIPTKREVKRGATEAYKGPSVISYLLRGRKARNLPVPAYKSEIGGDVTVAIIVNPKGTVIDAQVVEERSSNQTILYQYAIAAARRSRFTASSTAKPREEGEIVYRFIAQ